MVLEGTNIVDLVDTINYLLKQTAKAEDTMGSCITCNRLP